MAATGASLVHATLPTRRAHVRRMVSILSPLRYPGGKRRLASYIAACLELNDLEPELLVEPFAGGASVALQLAYDDHVHRIALGEKDPDLAAFWRTVFTDHEWLCHRIETAHVTLHEWNRLKVARPRSDRERAFRCLFLNRTSFSGIIGPTGGPIGGQEQQSDYAVDCRWNVDTLVRRIEQAAELADRVAFVNSGSWGATVARARRIEAPEDVFYYLDPPFYEKGARLYPHAFDDRAHRALRRGVESIESEWLLSYDPAPAIVDLYEGYDRRWLEFLYTTSGREEGRGRASELVITSLARTPQAIRMWRTNREWAADRSFW